MREDQQRTPLTARVELGQHVVTCDGHELGIVGRTTSKQFEVNARSGPYWLERQAIVSARGPELVVEFARDELPLRRLDASDADVAEGVTVAEVAGETTLPPEEERAQREMVERQLAEQRARLGGETGARRGTYGEPVESELERLEDEDERGQDDRTSRG